jgi:hypothetical protein
VRPPNPTDAPSFPNRQLTWERFANADRFPRAAFEQYFSSLVPSSPSIVNAGSTAGPEFWIDRPEVVQALPIVFVVAEQDLLFTPDRGELAVWFTRPQTAHITGRIFV